MKKKVYVEGMKCQNCVKHVKEALSSVDGIISADVNLSDKYVIIETNKEVSDASIKTSVNNGKYSVVGIESI